MGFFFEDNEADINDLTTTVGSFSRANAPSAFDNIFTEACNTLEEQWRQPFTEAFRKRDTLNNPALIATFKNCLLGRLKDDCAGFSMKMEDGDAGVAPQMYDTISALFDSKVDSFITEAANEGDLHPVKTIDFPLLVKSHIKESYNQIVATEIVPKMQVKKQIEHLIVYDRNDPSKTWEYPQCMYDDGWKEMMAAASGTPLSTEPQELPLYQFNLIEQLTDVDISMHSRVVWSLQITEIVTQDDVRIPLRTPMQIDMATGSWLGGIIDMDYQIPPSDPSGTPTTGHIQDVLSGMIDWNTNTVTLNSANPSAGVKAVVFNGKLSNDGNDNTVRPRYVRSTVEWKIDEGAKVDAAYTLEELKLHNAIADVDLYQKSYNHLVMLLHALSDKDGYDFLDREYAKYKNVKLNPLDWNSMILETKFDLDQSVKSMALQSEYIAKELKFKIDGFLVDIADTLKIENIFFVLWGNPRFIRMLNPCIKWVFNAGQSVGGVQLDHSFGVMTSENVKIYVVSSKTVDARTHTGLRLIPFWTDGITFKRFKLSTDIVTEKDSGYKDPTRPAGSQTYVWATEWYTDASLQGVQGNINFINYEDLIEMDY